jgi:hypothetical protein
MATSVVHRVSINPAAEAAIPEAPALGENLSAATLQGADWVCLGSRDRTVPDDADIDSESVEATPIHEGVTVRPPGSLAAQRYITRHAGIDEVKFTAYDVAQEVFDLDSNVESDGPVSERTATQVNRSLLVEIDGLRFDYYPNVVLYVMGEPAGFGPGDNAVNKYNFVAKVLGTDSIPSGQQKTHYEAGT